MVAGEEEGGVFVNIITVVRVKGQKGDNCVNER